MNAVADASSARSFYAHPLWPSGERGRLAKKSATDCRKDEKTVVQLAAAFQGLAANAPSDRRDPFTDAVGVLRAVNETDLEAVNKAILNQLASPVAMIPELASHLLNAGGKRLRPLLTLSAARCLNIDNDDHIKLAAAVELIHGATLLHDDVVDGSQMRRGSKTANEIWGNKESVLVGDFVFSRAFELMVAASDLGVLQILSRASGIIAEGEVLQLATQKNLNTTFEMYLAVVESKTAALFAAAAEAGAAIAGGRGAQRESLRRFGLNLGVAFQLIDDALDYAGLEGDLGKSVGDDFREGKMTLPVVYALSRATPDEKGFWRRVFVEGRQNPEDLQQALDIFDRHQAIGDTIACARRYAARALDDLSTTPPGKHKDALAALAENSVSRTY